MSDIEQIAPTPLAPEAQDKYKRGWGGVAVAQRLHKQTAELILDGQMNVTEIVEKDLGVLSKNEVMKQKQAERAKRLGMPVPADAPEPISVKVIKPGEEEEPQAPVPAPVAQGPLKTEPSTTKCSKSTHSAKGKGVTVVEGVKNGKNCLINTCQYCGERWFVEIKE